MRIINQKVEHEKYGAGTVCMLNQGKVYVEFGKLFGTRAFEYPGVLAEDKMKFLDEDVQEEAMGDIR